MARPFRVLVCDVLIPDRNAFGRLVLARRHLGNCLRSAKPPIAAPFGYSLTSYVAINQTAPANLGVNAFTEVTRPALKGFLALVEGLQHLSGTARQLAAFAGVLREALVSPTLHSLGFCIEPIARHLVDSRDEKKRRVGRQFFPYHARYSARFRGLEPIPVICIQHV